MRKQESERERELDRGDFLGDKVTLGSNDTTPLYLRKCHYVFSISVEAVIAETHMA